LLRFVASDPLEHPRGEWPERGVPCIQEAWPPQRGPVNDSAHRSRHPAIVSGTSRERVDIPVQPNAGVGAHHQERLNNTEIVVWEQGPYGGAAAGNTVPSEVAGNIRADAVWFYHPMGNCTLKPLATLLGDLATFNSRRSNYLLDVTPDDRGLIPDCQVARLREIGARAADGGRP
jgi:hypothetical protein